MLLFSKFFRTLYESSLTMLKIGTIYISIFQYIYARTYRYFVVPEVVSVNPFLKDKIHIFCCKHLKSDFKIMHRYVILKFQR